MFLSYKDYLVFIYVSIYLNINFGPVNGPEDSKFETLNIKNEKVDNWIIQGW